MNNIRTLIDTFWWEEESCCYVEEFDSPVGEVLDSPVGEELDADWQCVCGEVSLFVYTFSGDGQSSDVQKRKLSLGSLEVDMVGGVC